MPQLELPFVRTAQYAGLRLTSPEADLSSFGLMA